jgi:flavin-dependent dehydrogenase
MRTRVAIIGAGPAGTATALNLVRLGVDPRHIQLLDKAVFPRPKLCGGAITYRGTQALSDLGLAPTGAVTTDGLALHSPFGSLLLREPGPQLVYDRASLDHQLLAACRAAGVGAREGVKVDAVEPVAGGWRVRAGGAVAAEADWVVGADGVSGVTRRAAGLRGGRVGRLLEGVWERADAPHDRGRLHFYFDPLSDGIRGYAWIFPFPQPGRSDLWKIGLMESRERVPSGALHEWLEGFAARHGFTRVAEPVAGWPELFYHVRNEAHRPGLLLVGESHGTDPLFGEGIAPALAMAAFAAPALKAALDAGRSTIPGYALRFAASVEGRNLALQSFLAHLQYGPNHQRWLRRFFTNSRIQALGPQGIGVYGRLLEHKTEVVRAFLTDRKNDEAVRRG